MRAIKNTAVSCDTAVFFVNSDSGVQLGHALLLQEVGHALEADANGGQVVQHGAGGRLQDAHGTQHDEGGVEAQHKVIVCAHPALQLVGNGLEGHQLFQTVSLDGHVRDLAGNGSARMDGNADVGGREGRGVVDTVADHDDGVALSLGFLDKGSLILGQHLGKVLVHAHLFGDGSGG